MAQKQWYNIHLFILFIYKSNIFTNARFVQVKKVTLEKPQMHHFKNIMLLINSAFSCGTPTISVKVRLFITSFYNLHM